MSLILLHPVLILLGPTGAGKTPLGNEIALHGLAGRSWAHFDFGDELRSIAAGRYPDDDFSSSDRHFLGEVLEGGRLLEDEHFPLAERILRSFIARKRLKPNSGIILNGLPRHRGQAELLADFLRVEGVIVLECDAETIFQRIRSNSGGDRQARTDDSPELILKKWEIYLARTTPLITYYKERSIPIHPIEIKHFTQAEEVKKKLEIVEIT